MTAHPGWLLALVALASLGFATPQQPRDGAAPTAAGTASIEGTVVTDEPTPTPVRRAIVTVSGGAMPTSRTAITDDAGRFEFRNLPEGRVSVTATKSPYLAASYGAKRPGRPGTTIPLAAAQHATISIRMTRGSVATGTVHGQDGVPLPGVQVRAVNVRAAADSDRTADQSYVTSDDRGVYRLFGLLPGDYVIVATAPRQPGSGEIGRRSDSETDALVAQLAQRHALGAVPTAGVAAPQAGTPSARPPVPPLAVPPAVSYAPVFFPGTPVYAMAAPIALGAGEERGGLDFAVTPVAVSDIEGVVLSGTGQALATIQLTITPDAPRTSWFGGPSPILSTKPGADGVFKYTNVPPGRYTIVARSSPAAAPESGAPRFGGAGGGAMAPLRAAPGENLYAVETVDVNGQPVSGVTLSMVRGSHVSGQLVFSGASLKPPADLTGFEMQITPPHGTSMSSTNGTVMGNAFSSVYPVNPKADGTFELVNIAPGPYKLSVGMPPTLDKGWWLRSAMCDGRDLLDAEFEIKAAQDLTGVVMTFSDQHTELSGTLLDAAGHSAPDYFVIAFPANRTLWQSGSRRIRSARPGTDGAFAFRDLPPGGYRLAAVTDVEPTDLGDASFLGQLVAGSLAVTIGEGERKTQNIKIAGGGL